MSNLTSAFRCNAFPTNPRPFAQGLVDLLEEGVDPQSDKFKSVLFILNGMAYGQLASIDMMTEWARLDEAMPAAA